MSEKPKIDNIEEIMKLKFNQVQPEQWEYLSKVWNRSLRQTEREFKRRNGTLKRNKRVYKPLLKRD